LRNALPIIKKKGDIQMVKNVDEEKIKRVLTDPKMASIKAMLEKDHAIDCLLLLYVGRGKWKDAKDFMRDNNLTLSDGTFRARMIEIESLGLAKSERIDPLKKYYQKTEMGEKVAKLLLEFFDELEA
jgi:hypothetical protein